LVYELLDSTGAVIAEAEMVWEDKKIALLLPEQIEYSAIFAANGWSVISTDMEFSLGLFERGHDE
jgi:DEAD/DEAH box helicase domain-containing protein